MSVFHDMSGKLINWIITDDPRTSGKAVEVLRVAAGLSSWGQFTGKLWLCGDAALILNPYHDRIIDPISVEKNLEILENSDWEILVRVDNPWLDEIQDRPDNLKLVAGEDWEIEEQQSGDFFYL